MTCPCPSPDRDLGLVRDPRAPAGAGKGSRMKKRRSAEQIVGLLRQADVDLGKSVITPSPNPDPGLVRESLCPWRGLKGFSDEEATQCRADRGLASAG